MLVVWCLVCGGLEFRELSSGALSLPELGVLDVKIAIVLSVGIELAVAELGLRSDDTRGNDTSVLGVLNLTVELDIVAASALVLDDGLVLVELLVLRQTSVLLVALVDSGSDGSSGSSLAAELGALDVDVLPAVVVQVQRALGALGLPLANDASLISEPDDW